MKEITILAVLKTGVSKAGNNYTYLEIQLTDTLTKKVFLDPAEIELLKLLNSK